MNLGDEDQNFLVFIALLGRRTFNSSHHIYLLRRNWAMELSQKQPPEVIVLLIMEQFQKQIFRLTEFTFLYSGKTIIANNLISSFNYFLGTVIPNIRSH